MTKHLVPSQADAAAISLLLLLIPPWFLAAAAAAAAGSLLLLLLLQGQVTSLFQRAQRMLILSMWQHP